MHSTDLNDDYKLYYPTKVGCSKDERDNEYIELLDKITASPMVAVVNVVNNNNGTLHTIGFIPLYDENNDTAEDIRSNVVDNAVFDSEAGRNYDLSSIFDNEDLLSIEFIDTSVDLQKITDYLDCIYQTENFELTVSPAENETEDSFCNTVIEMNANLLVALASDKQKENNLVIVAAESVPKKFESRSIDNLPLLVSDVFDKLNFSKIGTITNDFDVIHMDFTSNDRYGDLEEALRDTYGDDWYDQKAGLINVSETEGPSSEREESEPEQIAPKKMTIETAAYKSRPIAKKVEITSNRKTATTYVPKTKQTTQTGKSMNFFAKLNFTPKAAAITFDGLLAIDVNTNPKDAPKYKAIDKDENVIEVLDDTIAMEMPLLMPVLGNSPEVGDFVCQDNTWYKILSDKQALNISNGTVTGLKMAFTQFFKSSVYFRPMIDVKNMMGNGMMMAMLFSKQDKNGQVSGDGFDPKMLMLMSMMQGQNSDFMKNPMFLMFLMGDQKDGGFDMKTLAMMSMFNGGANPFANFFGAAATPLAAPTVAAEAPAEVAPAKAGKRK